MKDTSYGMNFEDFKILCYGQGFEEAYQANYVASDTYGEEIILIEPTKGLLLYATSSINFDNEKEEALLSMANMYGEVKALSTIANTSIFGESITNQSGTMSLYLDVSSGMLSKLSYIDNKSEFEYVSPWTNILSFPFLWLINPEEYEELEEYPEYEKFGKDWLEVLIKANQINRTKIMSMNKNAQHIVCGEIGIKPPKNVKKLAKND